MSAVLADPSIAAQSAIGCFHCGLPVPPDVSLPFAVAVVRREDGIIPLLDLTAIGARIVETATS